MARKERLVWVPVRVALQLHHTIHKARAGCTCKPTISGIVLNGVGSNEDLPEAAYDTILRALQQPDQPGVALQQPGHASFVASGGDGFLMHPHDFAKAFAELDQSPVFYIQCDLDRLAIHNVADIFDAIYSSGSWPGLLEQTPAQKQVVDWLVWAFQKARL